MQRLAFVLSYPFLWVVSRLPFPVLYALSDAVYAVVFYLIGYRKKVVLANLKLAFPDKTEPELKKIRKAFYHHFCDLFLEMIKTLGISDKELKKRFVIKNPEELKKLETNQKSYLIMTGHYASYEWINALHFYGLTYKAYGVYKPVKNRDFDALVRKIRSQYNTTMLSTKEVTRTVIRNKQHDVLSSYAMIADQAPKLGRSKYWRSFMGHRVPVFVGSETLAKHFDLSVTYLHTEKVKRGHYEARFVTITTDANSLDDFTVTDRYFELLEKQIEAKPEHYLWTHKRWKHRHKDPQKN